MVSPRYSGSIISARECLDAEGIMNTGEYMVLRHDQDTWDAAFSNEAGVWLFLESPVWGSALGAGLAFAVSLAAASNF